MDSSLVMKWNKMDKRSFVKDQKKFNDSVYCKIDTMDFGRPNISSIQNFIGHSFFFYINILQLNEEASKTGKKEAAQRL